jgi:hypothetical protein
VVDVARERQRLRDECVASVAIEYDGNSDVETRLDGADATDNVLELALEERHLVAHRPGGIDQEADVERAAWRA